MQLKKGKKRNGGILSVRDFKEGVQGVLGEIVNLTNRSGEQVVGNYNQALAFFELADIESGEVKQYWFDGGLKGSFSLAKVKPGEKLHIQHTGESQITLDDGSMGRVQTYDICDLV